MQFPRIRSTQSMSKEPLERVVSSSNEKLEFEEITRFGAKSS